MQLPPLVSTHSARVPVAAKRVPDSCGPSESSSQPETQDLCDLSRAQVLKTVAERSQVARLTSHNPYSQALTISSPILGGPVGGALTIFYKDWKQGAEWTEPGQAPVSLPLTRKEVSPGEGYHCTLPNGHLAYIRESGDNQPLSISVRDQADNRSEIRFDAQGQVREVSAFFAAADQVEGVSLVRSPFSGEHMQLFIQRPEAEGYSAIATSLGASASKQIPHPSQEHPTEGWALAPSLSEFAGARDRVLQKLEEKLSRA